MNEMETALKGLKIGAIKRVHEKGYGFITDNKGNDIFFHCSNVKKPRFNNLKEGDSVNFTIGITEKGFIAENVKLINNN
jgi:CspA family cold shock protein